MLTSQLRHVRLKKLNYSRGAFGYKPLFYNVWPMCVFWYKIKIDDNFDDITEEM